MNEYVKGAILEIKKIKTITGAALMTAAAVILDFYRIVITQTMEISFSFLGLAFAGMLYGPFVGGMVGGITDILGFIIRPSGPFFIGFTISNIVSGVIFGLFLYKHTPTLQRIAVALLVENIVITLILTPIWLNLMYGTALFATARIIRAVTMYPIKLAVLYMLCRQIAAIRTKSQSI